MIGAEQHTRSNITDDYSMVSLALIEAILPSTLMITRTG